MRQGMSDRPIVRNVLGGDRANSGAWPWHVVISAYSQSVRYVGDIILSVE